MEVLHARCAGLDVHKDTVVACARLAKGRKVTRKRKTFPTTTRELFRLAAWLTELGCTHAVMEATGEYWKPVWHVLEGSVELVLANAMHVKNVPGRKDGRCRRRVACGSPRPRPGPRQLRSATADSGAQRELTSLVAGFGRKP